MTAPAKSTPRDAQVMAAILKDMGVSEYEPRLINLMLEFVYNVEDVKLAIQCRMDQSFTSPPPRDVLPLIKPYSGLRLPPDRYCLSAPNYRMTGHRASKKHHSRIQIGLPVNQYSGSGPKINIAQMSHGITGGKMGNTPATSPSVGSSSSISSVNALQGQSSIQIQPVSQSTATLITNPLKRKHEDDDYDT
ncbi:hypothetical protein KUTeg_011992 [Tegillarca granosa]|uniref:Transcription initiation factor TFIID subunit 9 n=1 Tax=Tegillarca granosa TaxID=220873 RepID=A0ABQ9F1H7_TEGGR|nr:hypothetical protein KUTeg_011992 [Tegillarca granosa]